MMTGAAQAQEASVMSASASTGESMTSAPGPIIASAPQPLVSSGSSTFHIAPPVAEGQRVTDRNYWTLVGVTAGAAVLDGETTIRGLQTPGRQEINPLLGTHPNRARFYTTVGAVDAGMAYVAYRLKRSGHDKLWTLPLV